MKKAINAFDYSGPILDRLCHGGILVTVKDGEKVNPMTIGWGTIGADWSKPVFQVYIRESRHTKGMLDKAMAFTVNVPVENSQRVKEILAFCGTKSGRDLDKVKELGLHLEPGEKIDAPAIRELPLTLECRVIYKVRQDGSAIPKDAMERYYPNYEENKEDIHTVYYGEILAAYLVE